MHFLFKFYMSWIYHGAQKSYLPSKGKLTFPEQIVFPLKKTAENQYSSSGPIKTTRRLIVALFSFNCAVIKWDNFTGVNC